MQVEQIAGRYARALFQLTQPAGIHEVALQQLRSLEELFKSDPAVAAFVHNPLIQASKKEGLLAQALKGSGVSEEVAHLCLLLAKKGRLPIFSAVVHAYEAEIDASHGVTRGNVFSAAPLKPEQRQKVEQMISEATGKKVILSYHVDPPLIGGVVVKVGGLTFDDSLKSHMIRLKEQVMRRSLH